MEGEELTNSRAAAETALYDALGELPVPKTAHEFF